VKYLIRKKDLIYPELSFKIIGILFEVFNNLGYGYQEKYYQKAVAISFKENKINFKEQVYFPLRYKDIKLGNSYFDFLVEGKIIIELKKGDRFSKHDITQIYSYLKISNLQLGLLVNFTSKGVKYKRILNIN